MRIKKCSSNNQRKRTLHRNKVKLTNRRHMQFTLDQFNSEQSSILPATEIENN